MDADAVFNVLPRAGDDKAAHRLPHLARYTHVKTARVKLADTFFITPDTTGGERGGHAVADGLLYRRERRVGIIRTAVSVQPTCLQMVISHLQVILPYQAIRIEKDKKIPLGTLKAEVSGKTLSLVLLLKITQV